MSYSVLEDVLKGSEDIEDIIKQLEKEMRDAAAKLDFERAAALRDRIFGIKKSSNRA